MNDEMKRELRKFVAESSLKDEARSLWDSCIDALLEEEAETIWDFIGGDSGNLLLLTGNLIEKSKIGGSGGNHAIESIVASEKKILERFMSGENVLPSE